MALSITTHHVGTARVIHLAGELDLSVLPQLDEAITAALPHLGRGGSVIVDLAELTFLDCAGIAALIAGRTRAAARHGDLHIRNARQLVRKVLALTGTLDYLTRPAIPYDAGRRPTRPHVEPAKRPPS